MRRPNNYSQKGYLFQVYVEVSGSTSGDGWVNFGGGYTTIISNQLQAGVLETEEGKVTIRFNKTTSNPYNWSVYVKAVFAPGMNET